MLRIDEKTLAQEYEKDGIVVRGKQVYKNNKLMTFEEQLKLVPEALKVIREKEAPSRRPRIQKIAKKDKDDVLEVDLHINELLDSTAGMSNKEMLDYQMSKFREVMNENINNKRKKIVFIHGKGDGVLKSEIIKAIRKEYKKTDYQDASFQEYGYGATMVIIK